MRSRLDPRGVIQCPAAHDSLFAESDNVQLRAVTNPDAAFRALSKTYGQMWLRCDVCRRYARLVEPVKEYGMADYRIDEVAKPERHPDAVKRLTEPPRHPISSQGWELPGRKMHGRR
jgi:hypothetical protein